MKKYEEALNRRNNALDEVQRLGEDNPEAWNWATEAAQATREVFQAVEYNQEVLAEIFKEIHPAAQMAADILRSSLQRRLEESEK